MNNISARFPLYIRLIAVALPLVLTACSSDTPPNNTNQTSAELARSNEETPPPENDTAATANADFIARAAAVQLNRIRLYAGHVDFADIDGVTPPPFIEPPASPHHGQQHAPQPSPHQDVEDDPHASNTTPIAELDPSGLRSGDLITVVVEFSVDDTQSDYSLSAQLLPESIFRLLQPGDTIGEVITDEVDALQGEGIIDIGAGYTEMVQPGLLRVLIYSKLPLLAEDAVYQLAVTPELEFLSAGEDISEADMLAVPVLIDERELDISKLDGAPVKIIDPPVLTDDNDFTRLDINAEFDSNGFTVEPLLQTFVNVDVSSFNTSEEVVLQLSYIDPASNAAFELGLLSSDGNGDPVVASQARFTLANTDATQVSIPLVAYATSPAYKALLSRATNLRDVADNPVQTANFALQLFYVEGDNEVSAGDALSLTLPLVSQDNPLRVLSPEAATGFAVLRAGSTNAACLQVELSIEVDSGELLFSETNNLDANQCSDNPPATMLWRHDTNTGQLINKKQDKEGNTYCITAIEQQVISTGEPGTGGNLITVKVKQCSTPSPFPILNFQSTQKFTFEGNKLNSSKGYLRVEGIGTSGASVIATDSVDAASDFFRDANGVDLDNDGRLFYVGRFYDRSWGDPDKASVNLDYGGETFMDYMPVMGTTSRGHSTLSASLFGSSKDLLDVRFDLQRYFPKKISLAGKNSPDVTVGNGAELKIDVAGFSAINLGGITQTTVTENYDPADDAGDILLGVPGITDQTSNPVSFNINETFVQASIVVVVIPVTIEGGVNGALDVNIALSTPDIGVTLDVTENLSMSGFLSAKIDAFVASGGLSGELEVINQALTFAANSGFNTPPATLGKLSFDIGSALDAELKLLKGKLVAFVEYRKVCFCKSVGKKVRKEKVIYDTDFLFSEQWQVYSGNLPVTLIDY